jgi:lipoate synthase
MGYADLISRLQVLPAAKQAEVFDFVEFLVQRNQAEQQAIKSLADSSLAVLMKNPARVNQFTPMTREEANAR